MKDVNYLPPASRPQGALGGTTKIFRRDAIRLGPAGSIDPFTLVFLDPPYGHGLAERALASAHEGGWLTVNAMVQRLAKAIDDILQVPAMRERLEGLGLGLPPPDRRGPAYLDQLVRSDLVKWAAPVKASGAIEE